MALFFNIFIAIGLIYYRLVEVVSFPLLFNFLKYLFINNHHWLLPGPIVILKVIFQEELGCLRDFFGIVFLWDNPFKLFQWICNFQSRQW